MAWAALWRERSLERCAADKSLFAQIMSRWWSMLVKFVPFFPCRLEEGEEYGTRSLPLSPSRSFRRRVSQLHLVGERIFNIPRVGSAGLSASCWAVPDFCWTLCSGTLNKTPFSSSLPKTTLLLGMLARTPHNMACKGLFVVRSSLFGAKA